MLKKSPHEIINRGEPDLSSTISSGPADVLMTCGCILDWAWRWNEQQLNTSATVIKRVLRIILYREKEKAQSLCGGKENGLGEEDTKKPVTFRYIILLHSTEFQYEHLTVGYNFQQVLT